MSTYLTNLISSSGSSSDQLRVTLLIMSVGGISVIWLVIGWVWGGVAREEALVWRGDSVSWKYALPRKLDVDVKLLSVDLQVRPGSKKKDNYIFTFFGLITFFKILLKTKDHRNSICRLSLQLLLTGYLS